MGVNHAGPWLCVGEILARLGATGGGLATSNALLHPLRGARVRSVVAKVRPLPQPVQAQWVDRAALSRMGLLINASAGTKGAYPAGRRALFAILTNGLDNDGMRAADNACERRSTCT